MPGWASVKIDKQISPENALAENGNLTPLRQTITVVEHKIRNLEKRKSKLESYKDLQNAGKELNADQKTAVAKYDEVIHTLDFARDLCKQFLSIQLHTEKEAKKLAKKESAAKNQAELARLREILLIQDALNQMGTENVREDFLNGRNGAAQLTENELKLLDDLYPAVTPKHEAGNPTAFTNEVQAAAEHLLAVVEGKPKEVFGGTYSQVKEILGKIHESGYFDQARVFEGEVVQSALNQELPPEQSMPAEIVPEVPVPIPEPLPEQALPPEQMYYPPQPVPPQNLGLQPGAPVLQPQRPISEMLGPGNFFFLQESEIEFSQEEIPTQTYTNQGFVAGAPPQSIALPHYQTMPNNMPMPVVAKNGVEEQGKMQLQEEVQKTSMRDGGRPPRPGNNQSYYQNNNGYSNRPRQNNRQNGPRNSAPRH